MQNIMIFAVNIVSLVLIVVTMYFNVRRHNNIFSLPTYVISKKIKNDNLKKLKNNSYIFYVLLALNVVNLFLPNGLLKFVLPAVSIVIVTNILIQLFEEIDTFNVSKEDVNVINDFKDKRNAEVRKRAKERENNEKK